jgi:hypothetical protein
MMLQRTKKQITYGVSLALATILLITAVSYIAGKFVRSPQEAPTPLIAYQPIILETVDGIPHAPRPGIDNTLDIVARLRNPNAGAGVSKFVVNFSVKTPDGAQLKQIPVETYIMPGAIQYVMAFNVSTGQQQVGSVEAQLPSNFSFTALPEDTNPPSFSAFARGRSQKTVGDLTTQEQVGIVKNTSTFAWEKVEVYVVGQNSQGKIIAAGKTFVGALRVGEEREFRVNWPLPNDPIERVTFLPVTNMFQEENVIHVIGNPGLLQ